MKRTELLELLIEITGENDKLRERLAEAETRLQDRELRIQKAGSMAEAVLLVNGVFDAAEVAAQQYLENIHVRHNEAMMHSEQIEASARKKAQDIIAEAERRCRQMESDMQQRCNELLRAAEADANRKWDELAQRLDKLDRSSTEIAEKLSNEKKRKWHL